MSRYTHQIIEIKVNGQWQYVPVFRVTDQNHNVLAKQGFVRDVLSGSLYDSENYVHAGVPMDISKAAREAFIYDDEDYVKCCPRWITRDAYEALIEHVEKCLETAHEKLLKARMESSLSDRLTRLEAKFDAFVSGKTAKPSKKKDYESDYDMVADYSEDYSDCLWAYTSLRENLAEISALAEYQSDEIEDMRICMFTC